MAESNPIIQVESLTVNLGKPVIRAVSNLSFSLFPGEILGLAGESGSGKSVTAMSLTRLLPLSASPRYAGKVKIAGVNRNLLEIPSGELGRIRGNRIGYVFQEPSSSFNPVYSVRQHLMEVSKLAGIPLKGRHVAITGALESVGLSPDQSSLDAYPSDYSGGMLQRLAIASALLFDPDLLIADEPTTALDASTQMKIVGLLQELNQSRSLGVLFISHDLALLNQIANRILVMKDGELVEQGVARDILYKPVHPYTKSLVQAIPKLELIQ